MRASLLPNRGPANLDAVCAEIAAGAAARDRDAAGFPAEPFTVLADAGLLGLGARPGPRPPAAAELALVRRVAAADGSVGRILDGHLNAVERLIVQAPADLRERELPAIAAGRLWAGVWGGEPRPGEGPPAELRRAGAGARLRGVRTFCSGAGGLHRALVLARTPEGGPPLAVWIDLTDTETIEIDRDWYRAAGLRASESHRVIFHDTPVLAVLGGPGAIAEQPWFGRDALRTSASWVGLADAAVAAATEELAARPSAGELEAHAAGRMRGLQRTMELWLERAARTMDAASGGGAADNAELAAVALDARVMIAEAARTVLETAARTCGAHPFAAGGRLDRARRDLELFLLQHRLDPLLVRAGQAILEAHR